jgi:hypothetical protein
MANRLRERRKHVHVGSRRDIPVAQRPENDFPCPQLDDSRHCDPGLRWWIIYQQSPPNAPKSTIHTGKPI